MFDLLVFIGRFQPFHNEHKRVVDLALKEAKEVLVLIGSCEAARTPKNPFSYEERSNAILMSYPVGTPLWTQSLVDYPYDDDRWAGQVREAIQEVALDIINEGGFRNHGLDQMKIGLIGAKKDDSSFYLDMFPEYPLQEVDLNHMIHATDIRQSYFRGCPVNNIPVQTAVMLDRFAKTDDFGNLVGWQKSIDENEKLWDDAPYPVKQVTADAVVQYKDKVLLVQRGKHPGKGLWALPGGHVEVGERVLNAAMRELREETLIPLSNKELRNRLMYQQVFDDPGRSTIGRVITHAAYFWLTDLDEEPPVVGCDDAMDAKWANISQITRDMMYDDHYHIIRHFMD